MQPKSYREVALGHGPWSGFAPHGEGSQHLGRGCPGDPHWAPVPCPQQTPCDPRQALVTAHSPCGAQGRACLVPTADAPVTLGSHPDAAPPGVEGGLGSS